MSEFLKKIRKKVPVAGLALLLTACGSRPDVNTLSLSCGSLGGSPQVTTSLPDGKTVDLKLSNQSAQARVTVEVPSNGDVGVGGYKFFVNNDGLLEFIPPQGGLFDPDPPDSMQSLANGGTVFVHRSTTYTVTFEPLESETNRVTVEASCPNK